MKMNLLLALLTSFVFCVFFVGCGSSETDSYIIPAPEAWNKPVIDNLIIPEQPDCEVKVAKDVHPAMNADVKNYIQNHIFWMGGNSVLITYVFNDVGMGWDKKSDKPLPESQMQKLKYIWLNPVRIAPEFYYPADVICLSNATEMYFSPKTINLLDKGKTHILMPYNAGKNDYSPEYSQIIEPNNIAYVEVPKIMSTYSFVDGVEGLERHDENVGYIFELKDETNKHNTYKIWFTGAIDNNILPDNVKSRDDLRKIQTRAGKFAGEKVDDARYMPDVDVIIVPIAQPSKISPKNLDRLARYLNAKAIYFIGLDQMEKEMKEKYIDLMKNNAKTPIWIPELATTQKQK